MAENKKSFIAYSDWKDTFDSLPDDAAGKLIKHIFAYVNDEDPQTDDILINAVFANIKNTLKRDLDKWQKQYNQRVEAGKRSAEVRKRNATTVNDRSTTVNETQISSTVSDSVSVSDNVTVTKEKNIYGDFISKFNSVTGKRIRVADDKFKRQLNARIKDGFTIDEILKAAGNCSKDEYHINNPKFLTPEFITRSDKLQKYLNQEPIQRKFDEKFRTNTEREEFFAGRIEIKKR